MRKPTTSPDPVRAYLASIGRRGGASKSAAKRASNRINGFQPGNRAAARTNTRLNRSKDGALFLNQQPSQINRLSTGKTGVSHCETLF